MDCARPGGILKRPLSWNGAAARQAAPLYIYGSTPCRSALEALGQHRETRRGLRTYRAAQFCRAVLRSACGGNSPLPQPDAAQCWPR